MELHNTKERVFFELKPKGIKAKGIRFAKGRKLLGSSETCEIYLPFTGIAPIHAVVEVGDQNFRLYDMNSQSGCFLNGQKVIKADFKINDVLKFGKYEFIFSRVSEEAKIPSVLSKHTSVVIGSDLPPTIAEVKIPPSSPGIVIKAVEKIKQEIENIPRVEYPLAKDPSAEFSEYIFEDVEYLYPIFKYDIKKTAVEVIILSKDRIFSIDYIPAEKGIYKLVGFKPNANELEFPYLSPKDKFHFLEISDSEVVVYTPDGYESMILSDKNAGENLKNIPSISLRSNDIVRFVAGDIQIFVRRTDAPPEVQAAPFFRRDKDFKKILVLSLFFLSIFLFPIVFFQVDKELDEEKDPERIATIMYKQRVKLIVTKSPAIDVTPEKPKEIQKSPEQLKVVQPKAPEPKKEVVKKEKPVEKSGVENAITSKPAKKAEPRKADVDKIKPMVSKSPDHPGTTPKKAVPQRTTPQRANLNNNLSKGHVDTYKAINFNSTLSSVLAKGGSASAVSNVASSAGEEGSSSSLEGTGVESATSKLATVSTKTGSLAGTTEGKLDASKGVAGLANKKSIYTVGVPSPEVLMGSMDPDVIRRILQDHIPQFRNCYQQELDRSKAAFDGIVPLNFIIGSSGHVTRAGVVGQSAMPANVKKCVINVLRGIRFPEPLGGGVVEVSQPMNFYPRQ